VGLHWVSEIQEFVKKKFSRSDAEFCGFEWYFEEHVEKVTRIAEMLRKKYGGDKRVVIAAAYLHDVGLTEGGVKDHEEKSIEIAKQFLKRISYSEDEIEKVCKAILATKGEGGEKSLEEKIVATADGMAHFLSNQFLIKAFLVGNFQDFASWLEKKIEKNMKKIHFGDERNEMEPVASRLRKAVGAWKT